jgi:hypothetical protein
MIEPGKLVSIIQVLLSQLEQSLSETPKPLKEDDDRTDHLKGQIERLRGVLKTHQDHDKRQREVDKQNRRNQTAQKR